jgi:predicted MFS family arabinose efflux permease
MPGFRVVLLAAVIGLAVGAYFQAWIHWPTPLAVAIGAAMAIFLLMIAASLGEDAAAADAAWREAAPDLVRAPGAPGPNESVAAGPDAAADRDAPV